MKLYGLTGGIGMGKSTSGKLLRERGIPLSDTDLIAHQLVEPGQPALEEIRSQFGAEMIGSDGHLRRDELARRVFNDTAALHELEAILHPRIRAIWQSEVKKWRAENRACGVVVIPLLFETDASPLFDAVICVACSAASQIERLHKREWDKDQIQKRIAAQMPVEKKMDLANYVIWTEGAFETHAAQLSRIIP